MRDRENKQKLFINELKAQIENLELKRNQIDKELKDIISQTHKNYNEAEERKRKVIQELHDKEKSLEEFEDKIRSSRQELLDLKNETANLELRKEEYSSKISQLVAFEKTLQAKISKLESDSEDLNSETNEN